MNAYMLIVVYFTIYLVTYTQIYYEKLTSIKTHAHKFRLYMASLTVERNVNKCKDALLTHKCITLTIAHTILL